VLRSIFKLNKNGLADREKKLRNEYPHNLYHAPGAVRTVKRLRIKWAGYLVRTGNIRNAYSIQVGKTG
jgi:hypothetical protein